MSPNTSPNKELTKKQREKSYFWPDAETEAFLEWWLHNREYVNSHSMSDWRRKARPHLSLALPLQLRPTLLCRTDWCLKKELFDDPKNEDLTEKKITSKHGGLIKNYKAVKREHCDTTGGGKNETDATLEGMNTMMQRPPPLTQD
jgi:hypothetical protein